MPSLAAKDWDGYRSAHRARSTGVLIVMVDGVAQGLVDEADTKPDEWGVIAEGRWFLICDEHATLLSGSVQSDLRPWMARPEEWCDGCRRIAGVPVDTFGSGA